VGAAGAAYIFVVHDVQPVSVSEFQGIELEDDQVIPEIHCDCAAGGVHALPILLDAGGYIFDLPAVWVPEAVFIAEIAAWNRGGDTGGGGRWGVTSNQKI
jgi:hypothetical protein